MRRDLVCLFFAPDLQCNSGIIAVGNNSEGNVALHLANC
jgi:hypothetical protein